MGAWVTARPRHSGSVGQVTVALAPGHLLGEESKAGLCPSTAGGQGQQSAPEKVHPSIWIQLLWDGYASKVLLQMLTERKKSECVNDCRSGGNPDSHLRQLHSLYSGETEAQGGRGATIEATPAGGGRAQASHSHDAMHPFLKCIFQTLGDTSCLTCQVFLSRASPCGLRTVDLTASLPCPQPQSQPQP